MIVLAGLNTLAHWIIEALILIFLAAVLFWIVKEHASKLRGWWRRRRDVQTARSREIAATLHDAYVAQAKAAQAERKHDDITAIADAVKEQSEHGDPVAHARTGCLYCITAVEIIRSIADDKAWDKALAKLEEAS